MEKRTKDGGVHHLNEWIRLRRAQRGAKEPLPESQAQSARWLWRLVRCVRALGLSKGVRYWRIENACIACPAFALQWADALESEALSHEANGVTQYAPSLRGFAADIRRHHASYTANTKGSHAEK